jgi:anhydro-N-acetylmuramic acid kinase
LEREVDALAHAVFSYPASVRDQLFALFPPQRFSAKALAHLHREMGAVLAEASLEIIRRAGCSPGDVTAIAIQAPTIFHEPPADGRPGVHMEVGEAAIVSERTGAPVLCDLRPSDIAAGGHGAPLSAFVDYVLFADRERGRAIQNIGGIANVTFLPPGAGPDEVTCFDTGPGNMVIDGVVRVLSDGREDFDRDGARAARGVVDPHLLEWLMSHPYVALRPPKTSGREDFGQQFADEVVNRARHSGVDGDDLVATVSGFTAECLRLHYDRELRPRGRLDEVILYGGGAHNPTLLRMIRDRLAPTPVRLHDEFGIPGDAREAVTWAVLADESLAGRPATLTSASGARHPVTLGKLVNVTPGRGTWQRS